MFAVTAVADHARKVQAVPAAGSVLIWAKVKPNKGGSRLIAQFFFCRRVTVVGREIVRHDLFLPKLEGLNQ